MKRKIPLVNGETYHIYSRSIADFKIFNNNQDYQRMCNLLKYYQVAKSPAKFTIFMKLEAVQQEGFLNYYSKITKDQEKIIQIISFCLMPTHVHLTSKQLSTNGVSIFISNVLNSYSRYFNTKYHRKGPLWESKFENVLVKDDEQLFHLTRYQHLNPVTAGLVDKPEDWIYSSYKEYIEDIDDAKRICYWNSLLKIQPNEYKKFVNNRMSYQRDLAKIKKLLIENES